MVRLRGKGLARLVVEDDSAVVYHCLQNSRGSHASGQDGARPGCRAKQRCAPVPCMRASRRLLSFKMERSAARLLVDAFHVHAGASSVEERGRLEFDLERAPALEALLLRLPGPEGGCTMLRDAVPSHAGEDLAVAQKLFETGIIVELTARGP